MEAEKAGKPAGPIIAKVVVVNITKEEEFGNYAVVAVHQDLSATTLCSLSAPQVDRVSNHLKIPGLPFQTDDTILSDAFAGQQIPQAVATIERLKDVPSNLRW